MNPAVSTFIFLAIAMVLLVGNILRPDVIALLLRLRLGLTGILTPQETFHGFSYSTVVIMFSAHLFAEGLRHSFMTEHMGNVHRTTAWTR